MSILSYGISFLYVRLYVSLLILPSILLTSFIYSEDWKWGPQQADGITTHFLWLTLISSPVAHLSQQMSRWDSATPQNWASLAHNESASSLPASSLATENTQPSVNLETAPHTDPQNIGYAEPLLGLVFSCINRTTSTLL